MIVCSNIYKSYTHGAGVKRVLDDINLTLLSGERLALLGCNGAGKTTLIKLIGGVEYPTAGKVHRSMSVSWPLGFAGGFQGSLTGYDNARFIARIYGRDYQDLKAFVEDFTELGGQLKTPVKVYSSGMRARLAFALSLAIEFDCYLIDEIILVGDQNFQRKCHDELFHKRSDRAMILASHNSDVIREYCSRAFLIHDGKGTAHEGVDSALEVYASL